MKTKESIPQLSRAVILVCIWICSNAIVHAQTTNHPVSEKILFQPMRIIAKDGVPRMGLFGGLNGDSIVVVFPSKTEKVSYRDVLQMAIATKHEAKGSSLTGLILALYVGNLAFMKAEQQPFSFIQNREASWFLLIDGLIGAAGAGIGSLVSSSNDQITFYSSGNEEATAVNWKRFLNEISDSKDELQVHLTVQGAWVNGLEGTSQSPYGYGYSYNAASNLNWMRKLQVVATLSQSFDAGLSTMWLGQPTLMQYSSGPSYSTNSRELTANGYYAVGVFKPLSNLKQRAWQWDVGFGAGLARVQCKVSSYSYSYDPYTQRNTLSEINTSVFSALAYTEFKLFLADYFTLGVVADYAYIPEDIPTTASNNIGGKKMGTSSIGFAIGIHF